MTDPKVEQAEREIAEQWEYILANGGLYAALVRERSCLLALREAAKQAQIDLFSAADTCDLEGYDESARRFKDSAEALRGALETTGNV